VKRSCLSESEEGGVLVELSLVVVALMFLLGAVFSVGRLLNQISWLSQTTYNALLEGASNNRSSRSDDMKNRASQLWQATHRMMGISNGMTFDPSGTTSNSGSATDTINFKLTGTLSKFFGQTSDLPVSITIQGAMLVGNLGAAGDLSQFQSANLSYNCNGVPCGGGGQPSCNSACVNCTFNSGTQSFVCGCTTDVSEPSRVC
jgi:hypothetical protein